MTAGASAQRSFQNSPATFGQRSLVVPISGSRQKQPQTASRSGTLAPFHGEEDVSDVTYLAFAHLSSLCFSAAPDILAHALVCECACFSFLF